MPADTPMVLVRQIDALLAIQNPSHPVPGLARELLKRAAEALSASPAIEGDYGPVISMETRGPIEDARRRREAEDAYYGARWPAPAPATPEGEELREKVRRILLDMAGGISGFSSAELIALADRKTAEVLAALQPQAQPAAISPETDR